MRRHRAVLNSMPPASMRLRICVRIRFTIVLDRLPKTYIRAYEALHAWLKPLCSGAALCKRAVLQNLYEWHWMDLHIQRMGFSRVSTLLHGGRAHQLFNQRK